MTGNQSNVGWRSSQKRPSNSWIEATCSIFMALASISLIAPQPAHAYINIATGSIVLQMWAAGWLSLLFYGKAIWRPMANCLKAHLAQKNEHASRH
jgi:hypothetical protein